MMLSSARPRVPGHQGADHFFLLLLVFQMPFLHQNSLPGLAPFFILFMYLILWCPLVSRQAAAGPQPSRAAAPSSWTRQTQEKARPSGKAQATVHVHDKGKPLLDAVQRTALLGTAPMRRG